MTKALKFQDPTEHQLQTAVVYWARDNEKFYPELHWLYAVPNGSYKSASGSGKAQREGLKSGVPDLHFPISRGPFLSLYIEMKRKGGEVSETQEKWLSGLREQGHQAAICYSAQDAISVLTIYLKMERRRLV